MKAITIEGETTVVSGLETVLVQNAVTQTEVIAELESIGENVDLFRTPPHPDIIFMNIRLTDGSAFEIFEWMEIDAPVILMTVYDECALQTFQVSSIDYLLKPVTLASPERVLNKLWLLDTEERLARIRQMNHTIQSRYMIKNLLVTLADKFCPLAVEEILYFCTANEKATTYTFDEKQHPVDRTLDVLGEQLDERLFFRVNRQLVISRNAIKNIGLWFGNRLSVSPILPVPERIVISKAETSIFRK